MVTISEDTYRVRVKITEILNLCPNITLSMIGTHVSAYARNYGVDWKVVLDSMVADGTVKKAPRIVPNSNRAVTLYTMA